MMNVPSKWVRRMLFAGFVFFSSECDGKGFEKFLARGGGLKRKKLSKVFLKLFLNVMNKRKGIHLRNLRGSIWLELLI